MSETSGTQRESGRVRRTSRGTSRRTSRGTSRRASGRTTSNGQLSTWFLVQEEKWGVENLEEFWSSSGPAGVLARFSGSSLRG